MAKKKSSGPRGTRKRGQHKPAKPASKARRSFTLANLQPPAGSRKKKVRVGRGMGSKLGRTAGAGNKGQKSRRGYSRRRGFEGGQMPLHRRMPKRGFKNVFREEYAVVNLDRLDAVGETEITPDVLRKAGVVRTKKKIKILGTGDVKSALTVKAHKFSKTAEEKITKAGGKFEVLE